MSEAPRSPLAEALRALASGRNLAEAEAMAAVDEIMEGRATAAQAAGFMAALRVKGETEDEIAGAALSLRARMTRVPLPEAGAIDTCGTGGDGLRTFNISTAAAFVVAGAGLPVAKHGNRAVSSRSGSADVIEALGVVLHDDPAVLGALLRRHRMAFLFAPHLHPAMRHAADARRELGIRTIFNLVGPLANPAGVRHQLLGVPEPSLTESLARVLRRLGARSAWVVCGDGGMDELTTTGPNRVSRLAGEEIETWTLQPSELGLPQARPEELAGGTAGDNAARIESILTGRRGADTDVVLLNAAAALVAGGRTQTLGEGLGMARDSIGTGAALRVLDGLRRARG